MTIHFKLPPGATPLDPNEMAGLIPTYISTQGDLDSAEQAGILEAESWAKGRKHKNIISDAFIRSLHKRMFKLIWRWAGQYRKSDKSIGIPWSQVSVEVKKLCDDASYWIKHETYPWDELAARFHHRLVLVHPFPNGNGRHARLMTDILLLDHDQAAFSWGANVTEIAKAGRVRTQYIEALQAADQKQFSKLLKFVRT